MERNYQLKHPLTATMVDNTVGSRTFQPGETLSWDEEDLSDPVVFNVGKTFKWKVARSEFLRSIGPVEPGPPSTPKDPTLQP
jgi:hypothetical protein